jgi:hypothetical protein
MDDWTTTIMHHINHMMDYRARAKDKSLDYKTRLMYDKFAASRERLLIGMADNIIAYNKMALNLFTKD